jgi:hypothetical protein
MSIPVTYWPDGALQGNIPVNDSLQSLAALGQAAVESTTNTPPTTALADVGRMWLVSTAPTGAWSGKANNLALCTAANVWRFFAPGTNAWIVWDKGTSQVKRYDTAIAAWVVWNDQVMRGFKNYLINGDFSVNQRRFAGGSLAAGIYGHDRWRADTGGANYSVSGTTITIASGVIVQTIEAPSLASQTVTMSINNPTATVTVTVDGQSSPITAGSGRRGAVFTISGGSTGNILVKLASSGGAFSLPQLEVGSTPTVFEYRPYALEFMMCRRYYRKSFPYSTTPQQNAGVTGAVTLFPAVSAASGGIMLPFDSPMRIAPAVITYNPSAANSSWRDATAGADRAAFIDPSPADSGFGITFGSSGIVAGNRMQIHWTAEADF